MRGPGIWRIQCVYPNPAELGCRVVSCCVGQRGSPWQQPHSFVAARWSVKSQCSSHPLSFIQLSDRRRLTDRIQPQKFTGETRQRTAMATQAVRPNHVSERQDAALRVSCLQRPGVRCSNFSLCLLSLRRPNHHCAPSEWSCRLWDNGLHVEGSGSASGIHHPLSPGLATAIVEARYESLTM